MAAENDENAFISAWNDSDVVLVVEDTELHVHKWILKSQSPVFKAMFEDDFKEATQDKIALKDKKSTSMVMFLKLLYPSSMFVQTKILLNDEHRLSVLHLAQEYLCVNLIKQCLNEATITPENVLELLPYAVKYHQTALPKLYEVINWSASTSKLEEILLKNESNKISEWQTMLLTKCRFLESAVIEMHGAMLSMIENIVNSQIATNNSSTKFGQPIGSNTPKTKQSQGSRCSHTIGVREISKAKNCVHCTENYKETFIAPIPSCRNTQKFFNMLEKGNDITNSNSIETKWPRARKY